MLDFGGVGKEFATDVLVNIAESCGIKNVMVNLGGDISVLGHSPEGGGWFIGLEDPLNEGQCHCGISLKSGILNLKAKPMVISSIDARAGLSPMALAQ